MGIAPSTAEKRAQRQDPPQAGTIKWGTADGGPGRCAGLRMGQAQEYGSAGTRPAHPPSTYRPDQRERTAPTTGAGAPRDGREGAEVVGTIGVPGVDISPSVQNLSRNLTGRGWGCSDDGSENRMINYSRALILIL